MHVRKDVYELLERFANSRGAVHFRRDAGLFTVRLRDQQRPTLAENNQISTLLEDRNAGEQLGRSRVRARKTPPWVSCTSSVGTSHLIGARPCANRKTDTITVMRRRRLSRRSTPVRQTNDLSC